MKDVSIVPTMSAIKALKQKVFGKNPTHRFIITVYASSVKTAIGEWNRPVEADSDFFPKETPFEEFQNMRYLPVPLENEMTMEEITAKFKMRRKKFAELLLFIALLKREPGLGDQNSVVTFWKHPTTKEWCHCLCGFENEKRYSRIGRALKVYPKGTLVITAPSLV